MQDFIANVLELFGIAYFQDFSNTMFDEAMYSLPFALMIIVPFIALFLFYKILDGVKGANTANWLRYGGIAILVTMIANFLYVNNKNTKYQLDFAFGDILAFLLVTGFYCAVVYVLGSLLVRYLSDNRKLVPFSF